MKNDLKQCKLGDVASSQTGPFGSQLHEEDYVTEGTPIVTVEHLGPIGFTHQNLPFVSDEDTKRLSKYTLKEGDIVFSRVGSIDRSVYVKPEEEGWLFSGRCIRVRCNNTANPRYLSFYFKLPSFKKMMLDLSVGATMPSLNTEIMDNVLLYLPSKERQDAVAQILNDIDTKIENNNAICADLEGMAKLLYNYWFVQFDFPDENRMPYKSSGGKTVWNEELKREIPEGWTSVRIGDISVNSRGISYTGSQLSEEGTPMLTLGCANKDGSFNFDGVQHYAGDYAQQKVLNPYDLIVYNTDMSSAKYVIGRTILVPDCFNKILSSHHLTKLSFQNDDFKWHFYYLTQTEYFRKYIKGFATGTNVIGLDTRGIEDFVCIAPPTSLLQKFSSIAMFVEQKKSQMFSENRDLASLRDFLLPMLMNGQVKVG